MHLTFSSLNATIEVHLHHPEKYSGSDLKEYFYNTKDAGGQYAIREIVFDGACLYTTDIDLETPCNLNLRCSRFCWIISFVLNGNVIIGRAEAAGGQYITYCAASLNVNAVLKNSARVFTICLSREFVGKFVKAGQLAKAGGVFAARLIDPRIRAVIIALQDINPVGSARRIFLESKILELLAIQLETVVKGEPSVDNLSKQDKERLQEAKTILIKNMQAPCSLMELARRTGLNDFKLKKGFKILFGNTVFGYLFQLRMETAYNLLQNSKRVSEVAEAIGYKNPHHFTAAFKKRYGFLPSQLNKMSA